MIYELSDVLLLLYSPPRLSPIRSWASLARLSVERVISPDMLCQFSKSFSIPPSEIKQLAVKSFKNLPEQRSFIRQTMGETHRERHTERHTERRSLMELVLFLIGHPSLCPHPAHAGNHLKRRLSSIKRLENFRGCSFWQGIFVFFFFFCQPVSSSVVLCLWHEFRKQSQDTNNRTHPHTHTLTHSLLHTGHTGTKS